MISLLRTGKSGLRNLLILLCLNLLAMTGMAVIAAQPDSVESVYRNGRIYTADDDRSWVEAVAINDGRFVAVGKNSDIDKLIGPETHVEDLKGEMVMPGIHDSHSHLSKSGHLFLFACLIESANDLAELTKKLTACRTKIRPTSPWLEIDTTFQPVDIPGFGKALLDRIFPDNAVVVVDNSRHNATVNSRALALAGIDKDTPDLERGEIVRDPETGEPTGLLIDLASSLVRSRYDYSDDEQDAAALFTVEMNSRYGITSVQDAGMMEPWLEAFLRLEQSGQLTQYVSSHLVWGSSVTGTGDESLFERRAKYRTELMDADGVKVWLDGQPFPPFRTNVRLNDDGTLERDHLLVNEEILKNKVVEWDRERLRIKMHAAGEGSVRLMLDMVENARKQNGDSGIIHEVTHAHSIAPQDYGRLAKLNVAADMSPGYGAIVGGFPGLEKFWEFRSLLANGALLTAGSDFPIRSQNVFPALQVIVTKEKQSIDLVSALDLVTRNGVKVIGRSKDLGSIEMGKVANMIVLSQNLFDIPKTEIGKTQVLKTVFQGRVVYSSGR
jgi:predicted amidohydrolase YtcJ